MIMLRKTTAIAASPDAVWSVLGDLAATTEWLPGTTAARMDGSTRVCRTVDGAEIREEISAYDPERMSFRFRHLQVPLPVSRSEGTFSVREGGGGSEVVLDVELDALDPTTEPELEQMFGAALEQALESLRRRVEDGVVWQAA